MRIRGLAAAAGVALALPLLTVHPAAAAPPRLIGELFVPTSGCNNVTELMTALPGDRHRVPGVGVITSMRTVLGAGSPTTIKFKVARAGTAANTWRAVGSSPAIAADPNTVVRRNVRIPTRAGDVLGVFYAGGSTCLSTTSADHQMTQLTGELTSEATLFPFDGYHVAVEGTWEPDADRDHYGDRTQDACPTDPTTHRSCATSNPRTVIRTVGVARNGTVRVGFGASEPATFRCAVDSPVFRTCRSPFARRLAPGLHTIGIVATDRFGNRDASPAVARVRVPRR